VLFSIYEPEIKSAHVVSTPTGGFTLGFILNYKTASAQRTDLHMPVSQIPHPGRPSELLLWEEVYSLKPGAVNGFYGMLTQTNQSLVAHRLELKGKRRICPNDVSLTLNDPKGGLLSQWLGDSQSFISIFTDSELGAKLTRQLIRAFAELKHPTMNVLDAGVFTLVAPNKDETFFPHNASFNNKTVATFTQFGLDLNFRLAESVLVDYDLSADTTEETRYLDAKGNVVSPNFFSWLTRY